MTTNDENREQTRSLTPEEQAEYTRLEQEEMEQRAQQGKTEEAASVEQRASLDGVPAELSQGDPAVHERFPVENGAVRWEDAANEGDTSRRKHAVYDTPWGRRELSATEVQDFEAQGHTLRRVDDEPQTSLEQEREELRQVELRNINSESTPASGAVSPRHNPFD